MKCKVSLAQKRLRLLSLLLKKYENVTYIYLKCTLYHGRIVATTVQTVSMRLRYLLMERVFNENSQNAAIYITHISCRFTVDVKRHLVIHICFYQVIHSILYNHFTPVGENIIYHV